MKKLLFFCLLSASIWAMNEPQPEESLQQVMEEALQMFEQDEALHKLKKLYEDPQFEWLKKNDQQRS